MHIPAGRKQSKCNWPPSSDARNRCSRCSGIGAHIRRNIHSNAFVLKYVPNFLPSHTASPSGLISYILTRPLAKCVFRRWKSIPKEGESSGSVSRISVFDTSQPFTFRRNIQPSGQFRNRALVTRTTAVAPGGMMELRTALIIVLLPEFFLPYRVWQKCETSLLCNYAK